MEKTEAQSLINSMWKNEAQSVGTCRDGEWMVLAKSEWLGDGDRINELRFKYHEDDLLWSRS